ncbi:MOSC domain-containing protein [Kitasatospora sp. NBC_00240]|uniref:MOSC domain-containing protein n=1 Tax=Kitasatospora sp. NBC_00240 TaxID=2903567 RepID=UPI002252AFDA|nr:MOSC domain-containing protein [Kitasatospora sp. NBC_00240]MCX5210351.1 MOSC domain-containing protein [Kitasatospora sp. NBC_00240]
MTDTAVGTVGALRRYPVKSMLGERIPATEVTDRGLAGDRRLALLDRGTGKVASAKTPRLWRSLLTCAAALAGPAARITGPAGETLLSTDAGVDDALSAIVGRPVILTDRPPDGAELDRSRPDEVLAQGLDAEVAADVVRFGSASPPGTFFDFAPVHLLTTATLDRLAALSPRGVAEVERYRPNLVIDTPGTGFVEQQWVGRELRIGDRLVLRVVASTPRCAVPTLAHGDLPRDADALRTPAVHNRVPALPGRPPEPCVGVYAQVLRPGPVREGDTVRF